MKKIECVILDWAGTAVDYGCFAPVAAFVESFNEIGVPVTAAETRAYMGLTKIEEVRALFALDRVRRAFREKFGRDYDDRDVEARYAAFQRVICAMLANSQGIKVGSTTGSTRGMMDIVIPAAEKAGYWVDNCVASDEVPAGRPFPYMIYRNMIDLAVPSVDCVVKCGDTMADIKEGVNAKVWTVGVVTGSNELALTREEAEAMPVRELDTRKHDVRRRMLAAGAHYVIDTMAELPEVIGLINEKMKVG